MSCHLLGMGLPPATALILGGLISMSSTALVIRLLSDAAQIDAPHGVYRVLPIHEGFPPRAGPAFELQIGDEVDAPVIEAVELVDGKAVFHGHALTESTWLEATYPDGTVHQVLPAYADGRLALSVEGLVLPAGGFPIVPVTPAPGGGRGPTFSAWTWDSLE